jgi:DNA modification methylase
MEESKSLQNISKARQMLAEAKTLDDVLMIRDKAEAVRVYAAAAKLGLESQNEAAEIKIRAERKAGELLREMPKAKGGEYYHEEPTGNTMLPVAPPPTLAELGIEKMQSHLAGGCEMQPPVELPPTLAELGVEKTQSHRWQTMAELPEEEFEEFVAETKENKNELTSTSVYKEAKKKERESQGDFVKPANVKAGIKLFVGDMERVLPQLGKFDVVLTDPPYNVTAWGWDKIGTDNDFINQSKEWLELIKEHLADKYTLFWFCSPSYAAPLELMMRAMGFTIQSRIVWHRRNMAKGSDAKYKFVDSWEMIFHIGNRELNFPQVWDDSRFDVQTFAVPQTNFTDTKYHPTQKPLALIQWLISYGSFEGDSILDPFAGSGTTAAGGDNRNYTLIEREEEYRKVIEQRFGIGGFDV